MASIVVTPDRLLVRMRGLRVLWAFKRGFDIPLGHVRGATLDDGIFHEPKGLRAPGLHVPGYVAVGSFRRQGEWTFWEVKSRDRAVVVELTGERYARLVLEAEDPRGAVDRINAGIAAATTAAPAPLSPDAPGRR